jgi:hypothetical protein
VPVRVDKLGAHLEAHVETIPAITALRLCNRFGKGENCHIHKLPVELVDEVEKLIIEPERERRLAVWIREMKCWSKKCYFVTDHLLPIEREVFWADPNVPRTFGSGSELNASNYDETESSMIRKQNEWDTPTRDLCANNRQAFKTKISDASLSQHTNLLKDHFGVGIWVSPTYRDPDDPVDPDDSTDTDSSVWRGYHEEGWIALAYLTLPDSYGRKEKWPESRPGTIAPKNDSGYGISLRIGSAPSLPPFDRFHFAMKRLGLKPFIHSSQWRSTPASTFERELKPSDAVGENAAEEDETEEEYEWPQLTFLVRSAPKSDG